MSGAHRPIERVRPPDAFIRLGNPVVRRLVERGLGGDELAVLHFTGRRSGRHLDVPVGTRRVDGVPCVFTDRPWRHNFAAGRDLDVTSRGRRRAVHGVLVDDPDVVAGIYLRLLEGHDARWARRHLGLRLAAGSPPLLEDLVALVRETETSIVRLLPR
ncbi:MAG TPA: hypothetical protein VES95_09585 [Dermatophilaceae bacterium]|nr:hypothetical protein [Dermatophilaceae bacterium]